MQTVILAVRRTENADAPAACEQAALRRGAVNTLGEPGDDNAAAFDDFKGEGARHFEPVRACPARTDNRYRRGFVHIREPTLDVQHRRRSVGIAEPARIARVLHGEDVYPLPVALGEDIIAGAHVPRFEHCRVIGAHAGHSPELALGREPRALGVAVMVDKRGL